MTDQWPEECDPGPVSERIARIFVENFKTKEDWDRLVEAQRRHDLEVYGHYPPLLVPTEPKAQLGEVILPAPVDPNASWRQAILSPGIVLSMGKRDSGKSVTNYFLLESFRYQLAPYVVGAPSKAKKLLPDYIGTVPTIEDLPCDSIDLIDEAYLFYHSRGSSAAVSKEMSQLLNLSRQRNQLLLFVSQEARQLDKNIASAASVFLFKDLGMLQLEFDRPELKKVMTLAKDALDLQPGDKRPWSYVYSPDADFMGLLRNPLPSFWKPGLSKLYAAELGTGSGRAAIKPTPQEKAQLAIELRRQRFSYSQIASQLGVTKSTVSNYLRNYPYSSK